MTRPQQRLLSQLATSDNQLASGLGQCLEALRLISALPRASPVFVKYVSAPSPTTKAFGRDHLSRVPLRVRPSRLVYARCYHRSPPSQTVITLIKSSLGLPDPVRVTTALFYREDGTIDQTPVCVDEDSWKELAPYVHTLHVEDDLERLATARASLPSLSGMAVTVGSTNGAALASSGTSGGKGSGLNSNASTFVPSTSPTSSKPGEGVKVSLQGLRKSSFSPPSEYSYNFGETCL